MTRAERKIKYAVGIDMSKRVQRQCTVTLNREEYCNE